MTNDKQSQNNKPPLLIVLGTLLSLWFLSAWFIADFYSEFKIRAFQFCVISMMKPRRCCYPAGR